MFRWLIDFFKSKPCMVVARGMEDENGNEIAVGSVGWDFGFKGLTEEEAVYLVYISRFRYFGIVGAVISLFLSGGAILAELILWTFRTFVG